MHAAFSQVDLGSFPSADPPTHVPSTGFLLRCPCLSRLERCSNVRRLVPRHHSRHQPRQHLGDRSGDHRHDQAVVRPGRRRRRARPEISICRNVLVGCPRSDCDVADPPARGRARSPTRRLPDRSRVHGAGDGPRVQQRARLTVQQGAATLRDVRAGAPDPRWPRRAPPGAGDRPSASATHARRPPSGAPRRGPRRPSRSTR